MHFIVSFEWKLHFVSSSAGYPNLGTALVSHISDRTFSIALQKEVTWMLGKSSVLLWLVSYRLEESS